MKKKTTNPKVQWTKFAIVAVLYLLFLYWVKSWWGLIVLPFIFDVYITKKIKWQWWRETENPTRFIMSWVDALVFALVAVYFINLPVFDCRSYIEWPQWKYERAKGLGPVRQNDIVVFNYPAGDTLCSAPQYQAQDFYRLTYGLGEGAYAAKHGGYLPDAAAAAARLLRRTLCRRTTHHQLQPG